MQRKKKVAPQRQQPCPPPGVDTPLQGTGAVECLASLTVEADRRCPDIAQAALLDAEVAVAAQCDTLTVDVDYAV